MSFLSGNKTYIAVLAAIAYAVGGVYLGHIDYEAAIQIVLAALGVGGLRSGIASENKLVLKAMGVEVPENASRKQVKAAVKKAADSAKKVAPAFVACFLAFALFVGQGCASIGSAPASLQAAERAFVIAQVLYNSVCAAEPTLSFCSEKDMQLANAAADIVRHRIEDANRIIAAGGTVEQVAAAVEAINQAQKDFERIVNLLQANKAKAMAAGAWPRR